MLDFDAEGNGIRIENLGASRWVGNPQGMEYTVIGFRQP